MELHVYKSAPIDDAPDGAGGSDSGYIAFRNYELDARDKMDPGYPSENVEKEARNAWERHPYRHDFVRRLQLADEKVSALEVPHAQNIRNLEDALAIITESAGNPSINNVVTRLNARRDLCRALQESYRARRQYGDAMANFHACVFEADDDGNEFSSVRARAFTTLHKDENTAAEIQLQHRIEVIRAERRGMGSRVSSAVDLAGSAAVPSALMSVGLGKSAAAGGAKTSGGIPIAEPPKLISIETVPKVSMDGGKVVAGAEETKLPMSKLRLTDGKKATAPPTKGPADADAVSKPAIKRKATSDGDDKTPAKRSGAGGGPSDEWSRLETAWNNFIEDSGNAGAMNLWIDRYNSLAYRALAIQRDGGPAIFPPNRGKHTDMNLWRILCEVVAEGEYPGTLELWKNYLHQTYQGQGGDAYIRAKQYFDSMMEQTGKKWPPIDPPAGEWTGWSSLFNDRMSQIGFGAEIGRQDRKWELVQTIGSGGQGHADLYVQSDEEGRITDRVVLKQTKVGHSQWSSSRFWADDARTLPADVVTQQQLTEIDDNPRCVVELRAYAVYKVLTTYRTYSEHCRYGDLHYARKKHAKRMAKPTNDNGEPIPFRIPNVVLCCIFRQLVKAAFLMKYGSPPNARGQPVKINKNWRPFVHCDIKPDNVFLAEADKAGTWPNIPIPRLGDYGLVTYTDKISPGCGAGGTEGFRAPEQARYGGTGSEKYLEHLISHASDVFGIGRSMQKLIELDMGYNDGNLTFGQALPILQFSAEARRDYPAELLDLIERCMAIYPADRIGLEELWRGVETMCTRPGPPGCARSLMAKGRVFWDYFEFMEDTYKNWAKGKHA